MRHRHDHRSDVAAPPLANSWESPRLSPSMASFWSKDKANFDHHVPCQNNIHVHVFIAKFWAKPAKNKGERPQKLDSLAEIISQQKWISPEIEGNEFD